MIAFFGLVLCALSVRLGQGSSYYNTVGAARVAYFGVLSSQSHMPSYYEQQRLRQQNEARVAAHNAAYYEHPSTYTAVVMDQDASYYSYRDYANKFSSTPGRKYYIGGHSSTRQYYGHYYSFFQYQMPSYYELQEHPSTYTTVVMDQDASYYSYRDYANKFSSTPGRKYYFATYSSARQYYGHYYSDGQYQMPSYYELQEHPSTYQTVILGSDNGYYSPRDYSQMVYSSSPNRRYYMLTYSSTPQYYGHYYSVHSGPVYMPSYYDTLGRDSSADSDRNYD